MATTEPKETTVFKFVRRTQLLVNDGKIQEISSELVEVNDGKETTHKELEPQPQIFTFNGKMIFQ